MTSKCEDFIFLGIVRTIYNPFPLAQSKLNKKAFNGCLFYKNKSCWYVFTNKKQDATPIFVAINSEGFAKNFKKKLIYRKSAISEIIITWALLLTCEASISNLFLIELMLI